MRPKRAAHMAARDEGPGDTQLGLCSVKVAVNDRSKDAAVLDQRAIRPA